MPEEKNEIEEKYSIKELIVKFFPYILSAALAFSTLYLSVNYIPRKEFDEYKEKAEETISALENKVQEEFVQKETYRIETNAIKESLDKIEKGVANSNVLTEKLVDKIIGINK